MARSHGQDPDARGADVVWLRDSAGRAARSAPLSLERIVAAAVAELDAHGVEKLTMRRLAERLAVTSTALYWHVKTKEDLHDLALDEVIGEVDLPDPGLAPRAAVRELLLGWRAAMLAHPWAPTLLGRPLLGPNVLTSTEFLQSALVRAGLSGIDLASTSSVLAEFVIGASVAETTWSRMTDSATADRIREHVSDRSDLYPTLAASGFEDRTGWSEEELFTLGLDRILAALVPGD